MVFQKENVGQNCRFVNPQMTRCHGPSIDSQSIMCLFTDWVCTRCLSDTCLYVTLMFQIDWIIPAFLKYYSFLQIMYSILTSFKSFNITPFFSFLDPYDAIAHIYIRVHVKLQLYLLHHFQFQLEHVYTLWKQ